MLRSLRRLIMSVSVTTRVAVLAAIPVTGFLINGIFGRKLPKALVSAIAVLSVVLSFGWVMRVYLTAGDLAAAPVHDAVPTSTHPWRCGRTWVRDGLSVW